MLLCVKPQMQMTSGIYITDLIITKSSSFMMLTAQNNGTFGLHGNVYTIYTI